MLEEENYTKVDMNTTNSPMLRVLCHHIEGRYKISLTSNTHSMGFVELSKWGYVKWSHCNVVSSGSNDGCADGGYKNHLYIGRRYEFKRVNKRKHIEKGKPSCHATPV